MCLIRETLQIVQYLNFYTNSKFYTLFPKSLRLLHLYSKIFSTSDLYLCTRETGEPGPCVLGFKPGSVNIE